LLDIPSVDLRDLFDPIGPAAMMREGMMAVVDADLWNGRLLPSPVIMYVATRVESLWNARKSMSYISRTYSVKSFGMPTVGAS
jgi:hypothetical protein